MKTDAAVEEKEEAAPPEDDGWMEVGKRNRTVITRTVSCFLTFFLAIDEFNYPVVDKSY
jgi:hypothetical protein